MVSMFSEMQGDCLSHFPERTLKLRGKISVETWSGTSGFASQVFIIQMVNLVKAPHLKKKNTSNTAL